MAVISWKNVASGFETVEVIYRARLRPTCHSSQEQASGKGLFIWKIIMREDPISERGSDRKLRRD